MSQPLHEDDAPSLDDLTADERADLQAELDQIAAEATEQTGH